MGKIIILLIFIFENIIIGWTIALYYKHYQDVYLRSAVKAPVRGALKMISEDIENCRYNAAQQKIKILLERWNHFHESNNQLEFSDILIEFYKLDHAE